MPDDIFQYNLHSASLAGLSYTGFPASTLTGYGSHGIGHLANFNKDVQLLDGTSPVLQHGGTLTPGQDACLAFVMVTGLCAESRLVVAELSMKGLGGVIANRYSNKLHGASHTQHHCYRYPKK